MSFARYVLVVVVLLITTGAKPAYPDNPRAELDGRPIALNEVSSHFCHDFDAPVIRCYRTAAAVESAVGAWLRATSAAGIGATSVETDRAAAAAVTYVKVYSEPAYAGSFAYLSQNYSDLGSINWSDKISSYIVVSNSSGAFFVNPGYGGMIDYFCCNQNVASLGTFNDKISSVRRN